jgi:hypothetical protein
MTLLPLLNKNTVCRKMANVRLSIYAKDGLLLIFV